MARRTVRYFNALLPELAQAVPAGFTVQAARHDQSNASAKWTTPMPDWAKILNRLGICFEGRFNFLMPRPPALIQLHRRLVTVKEFVASRAKYRGTPDNPRSANAYQPTLVWFKL